MAGTVHGTTLGTVAGMTHGATHIAGTTDGITHGIADIRHGAIMAIITTTTTIQWDVHALAMADD